LGEQAVPGVAAGVDDFGGSGKDAVGELVVLEVEPELLDRVEFGRVGRQEDRGEVGEARALLDSIDTDTLIGSRDRALIGVMVYSFARVNAVLSMKVKDYFSEGRRGWVRLHEKGGKEHEVPCHHSLEKLLDDYIAAAGIAGDPNGPLFRSTGRKTGEIQALWQQDVYRMIQRRAAAAGITTKIGAHTFRATGITAYLKNKGTLEHAQTIANHASPRTTKLYDRRSDEIALDEVEKIAI
jgi:integrase